MSVSMKLISESFMRGVIIHLFVFFSATYMIKWGECCQIFY
jgi:hypothetical protein